MKKLLQIIFVFSLFLVAVPHVSAHVSVTPVSVQIGEHQTFTVSVPAEKETATVGLRLIIPAGVTMVMPTVKQGWFVETKKDEKGENVIEVNWLYGAIPAGMRDEFTFHAQVPARSGEIAWKAYQTYEDGSVDEWIGNPQDEKGNPYSVTKVVDDLAPTPTEDKSTVPVISNNLALVLSIIAVAISLYGIFTTKKK